MDSKLLDIFDEAVKLYAKQAEKLLAVAKLRYNTKIFPTLGQYDWLSGVLLYCLIRYIKPTRVIEVSTSSGYSTIFSATALKDNKFGKLYTFELSPVAAKAAIKNFKRFGVSMIVNLSLGDARVKILSLNKIRARVRGKEILFLDSEHTKEFASEMIKLLLKNASPNSLFHVHDILPKSSRVTYRPISGIYEKDFQLKAKLYWVLKRIISPVVPKNLRNWVKPTRYKISHTTESLYIHKLSAKIPGYYQIYVHNLLGRYQEIDTHKFDRSAVGRCDKNGKLMEWNESWWVMCKELKKVLPGI